jgi:hypothetical protein
VVDPSAAGRVRRRGCRESCRERERVEEVVDAVQRQHGDARDVGHDVADGDLALARGGELGPVVGHARARVKTPGLDLHGGEEGDDALRGGESQGCAVLPPGCAVGRVAAAPEIEDRLTVVDDRQRRARLAVGDHVGERSSDREPPGMHFTVNHDDQPSD